jgi:hypothetical protein
MLWVNKYVEIKKKMWKEIKMFVVFINYNIWGNCYYDIQIIMLIINDVKY